MTTSSIKPTFSTLIVDDNDMHRFIVKKRFVTLFEKNHFSFSIKEAENGKRAWEVCKDHQFDFYVIDFHMPVMNGIQLCRNILSKDSEATIVLYTETKQEVIEKDEGLINGMRIDECVELIPKDYLLLQEFLEKILEKNNNKFQNIDEHSESNP